MSKVKSFKIFVDGAGYDATGYGITPNFFSLEKPNGETMFFPWASTQHIRLDKKWAEIAREQQAAREAAAAENPRIEVARGPVIPFDPNAPPRLPEVR